MQRSAQASWSSTRAKGLGPRAKDEIDYSAIGPQPLALRAALRAAAASWRTMTAERMFFYARGGFLIFLFLPLFQIGMLALIYGGADAALFRYALVAQVANLFVLNTIFWVGEILDRERVRGTLVPLFLAPCPSAATASACASTQTCRRWR
jgi:hypothetical protein